MSEVFLNSARASELWAATKNLVASSGGGSPTLQGIAITNPPEKTEYVAGDVFDPTGMVVTAAYDGGFSKTVANYTLSPDGPLEAGTDKIIISYTENGATVTAEQSITVTSFHIYGVTWDGSSTTKWTRTDQAALFTDPVPYVSGATEYSSPFDNLMPWSGMVKEERTGGTMVAIPKFWYKLEYNTPDTPSSGMTIRIADGPVEGFSVSPAHMDRGDGKGERDVVYIGRYKCGNDFKSNTGQMPKNNLTRADFRIYIHNLGATIWQTDFIIRFTIWLLYLVEFADWNSQKTIGAGCGNGTASESMGYTDSMPYHTGTTQNSRGTHGLGIQYRNIEGLWDNIYDFLDGCYSSGSGFNVIINPATFSDTAGGISVGNISSGYPSEFTISNKAGFWMFIPTKSSGSGSTFTCDTWFYNKSNPGAYVGGTHQYMESFGIFYLNNTPVSTKAAIVGARLQELP